MFYALLILPHIAAIGGLLLFALRTGENRGEEDTGEDGRGGAERPTPPTPRPGPSVGPPLPDAEQPRRLQVGEPLSARTVRRPRREREHPSPEPERTPRSR